MPTTQKIQTHKHIEFMKPFFILLGLSICVMSLSAQEVYQYNQFYYQRATLFEKLPIDSDDIVFLGNSITNGCEWHELFNNPNIKNRGISSDVSMGVYDRLDPIIKGKPAKIFLMIGINDIAHHLSCLLYTSPSPRDRQKSRMPSSA